MSLIGNIILLVVWISSFIFTVHIFDTYFINPYWNNVLPGLDLNLYNQIVIGTHFVSGIFLMILAPSQLLSYYMMYISVEKTYYFCRLIHKITGYFILIGSFLTSIGGILYIIRNTTIGGFNMSLSFIIYGALFLISMFMTWKEAYYRNFQEHKEWAVRLIGLIYASWFYRVFYIIAKFSGYVFDSKNPIHYQRPLDLFFIWAFYLIPMILIKIYFLIGNIISSQRPKYITISQANGI
jgi:hypothetical protein